ncbi:alkaline phosphatase [Microcoleus sp. FACHB-68]|uniref:alkaline phosphatase n=1 Tax=Microcoleus sp. FACHB-68 TaxID=2692826 RepID=UPI001A7EB206|nr:alkaline phosphatase [Microcoleus sp. FACHB-68]
MLGLYGARGENGNIPVSSANGDYSTTGLDNFSVFSTEGQEPDTTRPLQPGETDEQFIAREVNENPTLADMTEASLEFLGKDQEGFWLMVEGGDIDWSAHDDNIDNLLGTMRDFDKAVESTINWINENGGFEENLLIVTADHDHYLTLNENFPQLLREQGAETLTDLDTPAESGHFWGSDPNVKYGWGSHTNRPVPVYYQGEGSEVLDSFVGEGYNAYGYDIPGIPGLVDQTHIYQTMYQAVVNQDLVCGEGDDVVLGLLGEDDIVGNAGNDFLAGNEDHDFLDGGDGNDTLRGGKDADTLTGGNGDDVLYGDMDDDLLSGGEGADRFVLTEDGGVDTILDFQAGIDVIEIAGVTEVTSFGALSIAQSGTDAVISAQGQDLAKLNGIQATTLVSESFVFA